MRSARWLGPALLVAATFAAPVRAADCRAAGFSVQSFSGPSGFLRSAALLGKAPVDALLDVPVDDGRRLVRRSGRSGRVIWAAPPTGGGGHAMVAGGPGGREIVTTLRAGIGCGDVRVSGVDGVTGRTKWTRNLGEFTTLERPDVEVYSPHAADFDADGIRDLAILRVAVPRNPGVAQCFPMASGHCAQAAPGWDARVDVVGGRSGAALLSLRLGAHDDGPPPSIAWIPGERAHALAVALADGGAATKVVAYGPRGKQLWSTAGPAAARDLTVAAARGDVVVSGVSAPTYATAYGAVTTTTVLDGRSGAVRWSATSPGVGPVFATRQGDLVVLSGGSVLERRRAADGVVVWRRPVPGALRGYPHQIGDVDGGGMAEVVVYHPLGSSVVSAETGSELVALDIGELAYAAHDVTGDRRDDLVTIVDPTSERPVVRVRSGRGLAVRWSRPVTLARASSALGVEAGGGSTGLVIVYAFGIGHVALDAASGRERWRTTAA